jgi:hypothetical protein
MSPSSRREGGGDRCLAGVRTRRRYRGETTEKERRRHRDEAAEGEEKDAILDLLLKHSNTTLATYV